MEIIENVLLGDKEFARHFITFKKEGDRYVNERINENNIVAVINCTTAKVIGDGYQVENTFEHDHDFNVVYLNTNLHENSKITDEIAQRIVKFIDENRKKGKILIHCSQGVSRSPCVYLVYLLNLGFAFYQGLLHIQNNYDKLILPTKPMLRSIAKLSFVKEEVDEKRLSTFVDQQRFAFFKRFGWDIKVAKE